MQIAAVHHGVGVAKPGAEGFAERDPGDLVAGDRVHQAQVVDVDGHRRGPRRRRRGSRRRERRWGRAGCRRRFRRAARPFPARPRPMPFCASPMAVASPPMPPPAMMMRSSAMSVLLGRGRFPPRKTLRNFRKFRIGNRGDFRSGRCYSAAPMVSAIGASPSMPPVISSPATTGPTPAGVPVRITSPGTRW